MTEEKDVFVKMDHCYSKQVFTYVQDCLYNGVQIYGDAKSGKTPYTCSYCNKGFFQQKVMHQHIRTDHKLATCKKCNLHMSSLKSLRRHMELLHNEINRPIKIKDHECSKCGMKFDCRQELLVHEKRHVAFKSFCCLTCNKRFKSCASFTKHIRAHDFKAPVSCICDKCAKEFTSLNEFKSHMLTHDETSAPLHICYICGDTFTQYNELEKHWHIHVYKCETCDKVFRHKEIYDKHVKDYSNRKQELLEKQLSIDKDHPYRCHICDQKFRFKETYDEHQLVHLMVDP